MARISVTKQFEKKVKASLDNYFQKLGIKAKVENQWVPFRSEAVSKYSPRVDVAVGPFAYGTTQYINEYNRLTEVSSSFINKRSIDQNC